ncbi:MAG: hypothetical protein EOP06_27700, partial [Proteobacteria bacterium]
MSLICFGRASAQVIGNQMVYEVSPGSRTFQMIEEAVADVFKSPMKKDFCELFDGPVSIVLATGVSVPKALEISAECGHKGSSQKPPAKYMQRKYYIAQDPDKKS